ncbi:hypothetical protein MRS76_23155 [Rhizobiaceae bacterium n13]|uniref:Uncharacterized protein n=1 Tax=Ferirhizobium litorale TaxID=2927786 RepID=A0AAE3QDC6_9HYPH|nr:hypothetical protein [Fererhizobium litorale]MDI7864830.1 hypothetical protein [Fererhizobium litorale]MDI7921758.1 hypothetical protein [Fererhizobium litorale]
MQKAEEARQYLAETDPIDGDPLLLAEVGITAPTLAEVASVVHAAYTQWQQIGAAIEAARLGAKSAIYAAATIEEAESIAMEVAWPAIWRQLWVSKNC